MRIKLTKEQIKGTSLKEGQEIEIELNTEKLVEGKAPRAELSELMEYHRDWILAYFPNPTTPKLQMKVVQERPAKNGTQSEPYALYYTPIGQSWYLTSVWAGARGGGFHNKLVKDLDDSNNLYHDGKKMYSLTRFGKSRRSPDYDKNTVEEFLRKEF